MKNIFIITLIVVAMGYMVSIMVDKYNTIKTTNAEINKQK